MKNKLTILLLLIVVGLQAQTSVIELRKTTDLTIEQLVYASNQLRDDATYVQKAKAFATLRSYEDVVLDDLWWKDSRSSSTKRTFGCYVVSETCYGDGPCVDDPCEEGYRNIKSQHDRPDYFTIQIVKEKL